jgi:hypothetical protein
MTQLIVFEPKSQTVGWLMSLKVNNQKNRIGVCFRKIHECYWLAEKGNASAISTLQAWTELIQKMEKSFKIQIKRLSTVIERRVKAKIQYQSRGPDMRFPVSNPMHIRFYEILGIFDHLMCLSETCLSLKLFKSNRFFIQRMDRDKREMTGLVAKMSRAKAVVLKKVHL